MSSVKPRPTPPLGRPGLASVLFIRHPHYENHNTLLRLPALDAGNTFHYYAALTICGIISDNSWNTGWFARASDGSSVCEPGAPLAAADGDVFYFVGDATYKYPVFTSWDQWRLPRSETDLPIHFRNLPIDYPPNAILAGGGFVDDVKSRDQSCRLSAIFDGCDQAHLVPASETEWWSLNRPVGNAIEIDSGLNGILLRTDLHRSFEAGAWVPMAIEGQQLVAYVLRTSTVSNQFVALWHHTEMQALIGIDRRCLFARVAWAVLSLHHSFLFDRRLANETLLVRTKDGNTQEMAPKAFDQLARSRSRNPGPRKPPRLQTHEENGQITAVTFVWDSDTETETDAEVEADGSGENSSSVITVQPRYVVDDDYAPYERGRKRRRSPLGGG